MTTSTDFATKFGLTESEATARLRKNGPNVTQKAKKVSILRRFLRQFSDLLIVILLISAVISFVLAVVGKQKADLVEPVIIVAIVLVNAVLGTVQEARAEKSLEALQKLTSPKTKVVRDGVLKVIDSARLVVGDVCVFESGDVITADCSLTESHNFTVNESALTGESLPVEKYVQKTSKMGKKTQKTDIIFSGSYVFTGRAVAVVSATGNRTELGKIAQMLGQAETVQTPLEQRMKHLSKVIGTVCLGVCVAVLVLGFVTGIKNMQRGDTLTSVFLDVFLTSVSLAVAAVPEGLPAVVTVVLARGVEKMARQNAVVKRLPSVETLGSSTVICTDKTGTLTQNDMRLVGVLDTEKYVTVAQIVTKHPLLQAFCDCSDASREASGKWIGDPTEIAVAKLFDGQKRKRIYELPFDSTRKLMTVVVQSDDGLLSITKGSYESMLPRADNGSFWHKNYSHFTAQGYRVLALSVVKISEKTPLDDTLEKHLHVVGLFCMTDPLRAEAVKAVSECKSAGIRTVMVTGDNVLTASSIAREAGILQSGQIAVDGEKLAKMSDDELLSVVEKVSVFARVTPEDKLRIVRAWQQKNAVVAMTGDGVNDAPALKVADVGCAMGSGTEVAKNAADVILTDDNFATVTSAVAEGRTVYENVKNSVRYLLSCNIGEVLTVFFALVLFGGSPLVAMQLLWINLVTDGLPALALGTQPAVANVMKKPPKSKNETFFDGGVGKNIAFSGVLFAVASLVAYAVGLNSDTATASTMAFVVLSVSQLFYAVVLGAEGHSLKNAVTPLVAVSFAVGLAMVAVVLFTPLASVFKLVRLTAFQHVCALCLSLVPSLAGLFYRFTTCPKGKKPQRR